jgi:hypothetical protein
LRGSRPLNFSSLKNSLDVRDVIRRAAKMAGLSLDDDRIDELGPLVEELTSQFEALRRLDPDGVEQVEPAFGFRPSAWTNQSS